MHFSHYCLEHNSKTNYPKMFRFGIWNDMGISYKWYGFEVESSEVKVRVTVTTIWHVLELYECLLTVWLAVDRLVF